MPSGLQDQAVSIEIIKPPLESENKGLHFSGENILPNLLHLWGLQGNQASFREGLCSVSKLSFFNSAPTPKTWKPFSIQTIFTFFLPKMKNQMTDSFHWTLNFTFHLKCFTLLYETKENDKACMNICSLPNSGQGLFRGLASSPYSSERVPIQSKTLSTGLTDSPSYIL